ncbi:hypothetical protein V8C86DRAFT_3032280 [Haematococcus lacustris]
MQVGRSSVQARPPRYRICPALLSRPSWARSRHRPLAALPLFTSILDILRKRWWKQGLEDGPVARSRASKARAREGREESFLERQLYLYYNVRSTTSDLQLFLALFLSVSLVNSCLRSLVVDGGAPSGFTAFWRDIYEVLILSFGQEFPEVDSPSISHQAFSVLVAAIGLASFALVLALVEQVVLEVIEENVRRGTRVFEAGHVLVLGWATSQRDLEVVWKTLEQLTHAYRNDGGATVVVLTQRPKLEMEALIKRVLPETDRLGSRFVFREGSPLVPADLETVAARHAAKTIVISDQSRCPEEADAQSVRCAILLDEMCDNPREGGQVVVQMSTSNAIPILRYACSSRVVPLPTARLNARRVAKMVKSPFIAAVSKQIMDFSNKGPSRRSRELNPAPGVGAAAQGGASGAGAEWRQQPSQSSSSDGSWTSRSESMGGGSDGSRASSPPCAPLRASKTEEGLEPGRLNSQYYQQQGMQQSQEQTVSRSRRGTTLSALAAGGGGAREGSVSRASSLGRQGGGPGGLVRALLTDPRQRRAAGSPLDAPQQQQQDSNMIFMVPVEYLVEDDRPERVLVAGWSEQSFMHNVLRELDHGESALPLGSEVVFVNTHSPQQLEYALRATSPRNIKVSHLQADPLQRHELMAVGLEGFKCAIVLCDDKWIDPDQDSANGIDELRQRDMLRLDAMVMMVQLNIRKVLDDGDRPTINIICQKVAFEGMTRFEDRNRLPLGISINFSSYSAKLLTQVAYSPASLIAYSNFGENADLVTIDASELADEGEAVSFMAIQRRAQLRRMTLVGWYMLPRKVEGALKLVVNPLGEEARSKARVWNTGEAAGKFIVLRPSLRVKALSTASLDDSYQVESHKQARWVVLAQQQAEQRAQAQAQAEQQAQSNSSPAPPVISLPALPGSITPRVQHPTAQLLACCCSGAVRARPAITADPAVWVADGSGAVFAQGEGRKGGKRAAGPAGEVGLGGAWAGAGAGAGKAAIEAGGVEKSAAPATAETKAGQAGQWSGQKWLPHRGSRRGPVPF